MKKIKFLTSGESHGELLMGILEGIPSNLKIDETKGIRALKLIISQSIKRKISVVKKNNSLFLTPNWFKTFFKIVKLFIIYIFLILFLTHHILSSFFS